ncbi:MAG: hypothetical protein FWE71_15240 [Nocardioidaceae bacterium]|nr:hypothetical protein [Nocardioidaceae bacterium]
MSSVHPTPRNVRRRGTRAGRAAVVLAGLVCALAGVGATSSPAGAAPDPSAASRSAQPCTVKLGDRTAVQQAAAHTDAVFAAKVDSVTKSSAGGSTGRAQAGSAVWMHKVHVLAGFSGAPHKGGSAQVILTPEGTGPANKLDRHGTYVFFATQEGDHFTAPRCGGAVLLRKGLTSAVRKDLGSALSQPASQGVDLTWTTPKGGVRSLPRYSRLVAPGAGLILIGLLGLVLVGRLGRERA